MNFDTYLDQAWTDHATDSAQVAANFEKGLELLEKEEQVGQLVHLITHVTGEHLGAWDRGLTLLNQIENSQKWTLSPATTAAIARSRATLELSAGRKSKVDSLTISDQIRVYASAATALGSLGQVDLSLEYFQKSLSLIPLDFPKNDPAFRTLAAMGNNLAATLEEKPQLNNKDVELMIYAAKLGRKYWEVAGTWLEVERAEYRLAHSFLKAGDMSKALEHAQLCLEGIEANKAPALEYFFGYEILAKIEKVKGNPVGFDQALKRAEKYFNEMSEDDQKWSRSSLEALKK